MTIDEAAEHCRAAHGAKRHELDVDRILRDNADVGWPAPAMYPRPGIGGLTEEIADAIMRLYRTVGWDCQKRKRDAPAGGYSVLFDFPDEKVW